MAAIEAAGLGRGWIDGELGHGRAFRFVTPEGHPMEIFWEVEYATTPGARDGPSQPAAAPAGGRGADPAHRPPEPDGGDTAACRDFMVGVLGFRERERVMGGGDGGGELA